MLEGLITNIFRKQIHLVYQAKDFCGRRELCQRVQAVFKLCHIVALEIFAGDIKHINQYLDIFEDVLSLALEELLHEEVLASTIPQ